jgi:hypothetical protein
LDAGDQSKIARIVAKMRFTDISGSTGISSYQAAAAA